MPVRRSPDEERELEEKALREKRIQLQREIADQLAEQQRIYDEVMKPNSADAKLLMAQVRGATGEKPLSTKTAKVLEGMDSPTARFEWSRAEVARISAKVRSLRTKLAKVEAALDGVREAGYRAVGSVPSARWLRRYRDLLTEVR